MEFIQGYFEAVRQMVFLVTDLVGIILTFAIGIGWPVIGFYAFRWHSENQRGRKVVN
jgi:hypothetical protein